MIPTLRISTKEWRQKLLQVETFDTLCSQFQEYGCIRIDNVFSTEFIHTLHALFRRRYKRFFAPPKAGEHPDALRVGDHRWMVTVKVEALFASSLLYAHPLLYPWIEYTLGQECKIDSFGAVVSLPGAREQHGHRDLPELFDDTPIDTQLPCYGITMMVPLIECNAYHGTTHVHPGSHHALFSKAESMARFEPEIPIGSCLLMDYRLYHGGTANSSPHARPLLYQVYSRPWFQDYRNFKKQQPLWMTHRAYRQLAPEHAHLFRYAHRTWL